MYFLSISMKKSMKFYGYHKIQKEIISKILKLYLETNLLLMENWRNSLNKIFGFFGLMAYQFLWVI